MGDLETAWLALLDGTAQHPECLQEKRFDKVRLKTPRFRALHVLANLHYFGSIHAVVGERALFEKFLTMLSISQVIHDLMETRLHFRPVAVANRFDKQVAEALFAEKL